MIIDKCAMGIVPLTPRFMLFALFATDNGPRIRLRRNKKPSTFLAASPFRPFSASFLPCALRLSSIPQFLNPLILQFAIRNSKFAICPSSSALCLLPFNPRLSVSPRLRSPASLFLFFQIRNPQSEIRNPKFLPSPWSFSCTASKHGQETDRNG